MELAHIQPTVKGEEIGFEWIERGAEHALASKWPISGSWFGHEDCQGLISINHMAKNDLAWTHFVQSMRRGSEYVGFSSEHSGKIAAAIGEIFGNVIDHSERIESGYIAYHAGQKEFEFAIADKGVGVLASLQSNKRFANLADAGQALELAMEPGVSRIDEPGRGTGFVSFFTGLANVSRQIRFRSGDSGRVIERGLNGVITAKTLQLPQCPGLFCSVLCDTK